jgi:hypothetical protein
VAGGAERLLQIGQWRCSDRDESSEGRKRPFVARETGNFAIRCVGGSDRSGEIYRGQTRHSALSCYLNRGTLAGGYVPGKSSKSDLRESTEKLSNRVWSRAQPRSALTQHHRLRIGQKTRNDNSDDQQDKDGRFGHFFSISSVTGGKAD